MFFYLRGLGLEGIWPIGGKGRTGVIGLIGGTGRVFGLLPPKNGSKNRGIPPK